MNSLGILRGNRHVSPGALHVFPGGLFPPPLAAPPDDWHSLCFGLTISMHDLDTRPAEYSG